MLMSMVGTLSSAHDIAVKNADGKPIFYNYANNKTELAVTFEGSTCSEYEGEYSGIINIPESVTYNGTTYPVTNIGSYAFDSCRKLTKINIPNSVKKIGWSAFSACVQLTKIDIPNSVESIDSYAFQACTGLTSVTISNSVTSIEQATFSDCRNLTSVTIPNSVASIDTYAFSGCRNLTKIDIPNSVTNIGFRAFQETAWYDNQPNGLVYAGKVAYAYKGTMPAETSIKIQEGTVGIGEAVFKDCSNLTSIEIPNSVTNIGTEAFSGCYRLTSLHLPNDITTIGYKSFYNCRGLTSVTIPNSVSTIGEAAFYGIDNLTSVIIESNAIVSKKYSLVFTMSDIFGRQVKSYTLGNDVTSIGDYAFGGCERLETLSMGGNVTSIGKEAFFCQRMTKFVSLSVTPPACGSSALQGIDKSACKLFVPSGSLDSYKVADQWKDFFLIEEINTTGITSMQETKPESSEYTTTYDLNGRKTVGLQRGMNIVRLKNGETRKVVVK